MFGDPYRSHVDFGSGPEPALLLEWLPGAGLCLRGDGSIEEVQKDFITIDWRYDARSDKWLDLADIGLPAEPSQDDQTES